MSNEKNEKKNKLPKKSYRGLRLLGKLMLGIILVFTLLVLFIRSPWGQDIIKDRLVKYVSNKTKTEVQIDRLFITFDGNIQLNGLFLEDKVGDTLIYTRKLEANLAIWNMINGESQTIDGITIDELTANIKQKDTLAGFNFAFLVDAFVSPETQPVQVDTTNTAQAPIKIKTFAFKDIIITFQDAVSGIDSRIKFNTFKGEDYIMNMETMLFSAEALQLNNANIKLIQTPVPTKPNTEESTLPTLILNALTLTNVKLDYQNKATDMSVNASVVDFYTEIPKINLQENDLNIDKFNLKDSEIIVHTKSSITEAPIKETPDENIDILKWPAISVALNNINLKNNTFGYYTDNQTTKSNIFNPNAILINNFTLQAETLSLKNKEANIAIKKIAFNEASDYQLHDLALHINVTDTQLKVDQFLVALNKNKIHGQLDLKYTELASLIKTPEQSKLNLNLHDLELHLEDLYAFQPDLKNNTYFSTLTENSINGNLAVSGYLSDIVLSKFNMYWGNSTKISARGNFKNITNPDALQFNISNFLADTKSEDLIKFIGEQDASVNLPNAISLSGSISGNLNTVKTDAKLTTSQGSISAKGDFKNGETLAFNTDITIKNYQIDALLKNPELGTFSASVKAAGSGKDLNTLNANLEAKIDSLKLNTYTIKNLNLDGAIKDGKGKLASNYKDENINLNLESIIVLDSIASEIAVDLNLIGADLQALGLTNRAIKTKLRLHADVYGNTDSYNVAAAVHDGVFVYDNKTYILGDLDAKAHTKTDTTSITVKNKIFDLNLESNTDPETFSNALKQHIFSYFYRDTLLQEPDSLVKPVNLTLKGHIAQAPILDEVFLVNLKDLDTIDIAIDFNESKRQLKANITAPHINYNAIEIDSLDVTMNTDNDSFSFDFGFNQIKAGPLELPKSKIKGQQLNNLLSMNVLAFHDDIAITNIKAEITGNRERLRFHLLPDNLILNKKIWNLPNTNEIIITKDDLEFNDFRINKNDQSISVTDKNPSVSKKHMAIDFENFKINEILAYLNPDKKLASGNLNGHFIIEEPLTSTGIIADLAISKLGLLDVNLGTLSLKGSAMGADVYTVKVDTKGGDIDMDISGQYLAKNTAANLDLDIAINAFKMKALTGFTQGAITDASGIFNGQFKIDGTVSEPSYKGFLSFNNAKFNVAALNTAFTLKDEKLSIDNASLSMADFTILDAQNNRFVVSGAVGTKSLINPTFDLKVKATNFQMMNATKEDNNLLYGKVNFDANASITGDLLIPKVNMTLKVGANTDVTYVMPSTTANIEEREGVVVFVNRENPDAILTRNEEKTATLKGFDIKAKLKVDKKAAVTIIIDEQTGDNFKVAGDADLNFSIKPNGNMNLVGAYEVSQGHYEMNLYNLVNRKFELAKGSRVTWSGNPFDANMDVSAIYKIETAASALMASTNTADSGKYRQVLPFSVFLNIDGELMAPKISFKLDMPEDEQGAVGGQVFGRVQQINQQEEELNRQVFSLLVLNRFYPNPGSDGSQGGVATIARDNLNDALSDQLNVFSDKIFGKTGFEVDFGVNSFTDYQGNTPQDRTQLDIAAQKKLLDDRLIVRVGSEIDIQGSSNTNQETPLVGNVSLEYLLTENGRYRLKGFRKNEFENVIDGQTIVTGIGLIFTKEFNKFSTLWKSMFKSEKEENPAEETKENKE